MKPGVYDNVSNGDYHGGPGSSKSFLDLVARSPLHAKHAREQANDNPPTAAQAIGTAFHTLLLEPDVFVKEYCLGLRQADVPHAIADKDTLVAMVAKLNETRLPKLSTSGTKDELVARILELESHLPDDVKASAEKLAGWKLADLKAFIATANESRPGLLSDKGTMAELAEILRANGHEISLWSEIKSVWLENNGHRNVLDADAWDQLHRMRDAVYAHPAARALLTAVPGKAEQSVYWIDAETGELCRCRPDFWRLDGIVVDVKTCEDASPEGFAKSIHNWRYHVQHPFYQDGINAMREQLLAASQGEEFPPQIPAPVRAFVFLAVEKKAPHAVAVYMLDAEAVELGRMEYRRDLNTLHQCIETGVWPGYGDAIQPITLPAWAFTKALAA